MTNESIGFLKGFIADAVVSALGLAVIFDQWFSGLLLQTEVLDTVFLEWLYEFSTNFEGVFGVIMRVCIMCCVFILTILRIRAALISQGIYTPKRIKAQNPKVDEGNKE